MALEARDLGVVAAELMERLEEDYATHENVTLGVVAVVAEVNYGPGDDEVCAVEFRCSDGRRWIQRGLFDAAIRAVNASSEDPDD